MPMMLMLALYLLIINSIYKIVLQVFTIRVILFCSSMDFCLYLWTFQSGFEITKKMLRG